MTQPRPDRAETDRYDAALALEGLALPGILDAARPLLSDESWRVRRAAWESLAKVCTGPVGRDALVEFLLSQLETSEDERERASLLDALTTLAREGAAAMVASLSRRSARGRKFVLDVLAGIEDPAVCPAARALLDDPDENTAFAAAEVLGASGDAADAEHLLSRAGGNRALTFAVLSAVAAIARRHPVTLDPAVVRPALDDAITALPVLQLLGATGDEASVELLRAHLRVGPTLEPAILALRELLTRMPRLIPPLENAEGDVLLQRAALPTARTDVRRAVFTIMARCLPQRLREACDALVDEDPLWVGDQLAEQPDSILRGLLSPLAEWSAGRVAVARVLARRPDLEGEALLLSLVSQMGTHQPEAIEALGQIGSARCVPHLLPTTIADEQSAEVAVGALLRLIRRGVPGAAEALLRAVPGLDSHGLARVLPAVAAIGSPESSAVVEQALRDSDGEQRRAAVYALRFGGGAVFEAALVARLADESDEVRAAAATVVGELGLQRAVEALKVLLDDESPWVQASAVRALAALGEPLSPDLLIELLSRGGIVAAEVAHVVGERIDENAFPRLVAALGELEDDALAELIRSLAGYAQEIPREEADRLLGHRAWSVRAAVAGYLAGRAMPWMRELARTRLGTEADALVRFRLEEAARG